METRIRKVNATTNNDIQLKVIPGHFATNHSHVNYYIDMTTLKVRQTEAAEVAAEMAKVYSYSTIVDTIVCMDECDIIGAYLASELTNAGIMSMNTHKSIYIVTPEFNTNGQLIFRDNIQPMIHGKHVLLLLATATTGKTVARALECIEYYGGTVQGISAIFSAAQSVNGHTVNAVFTTQDLPDYATYKLTECPLCQQQSKIDAMVNGFGYTKL